MPVLKLKGADFMEWFSRWGDPMPWPDFFWRMPDAGSGTYRNEDGSWKLDPESSYDRELLGEIRSSSIARLVIDTDAIIASCIEYDRTHGKVPAASNGKYEENPPMAATARNQPSTEAQQPPPPTAVTRSTVVVVPLEEHAGLRESLRSEGVLTLETPSNGKKVTGADFLHFLDTAIPDGLSWQPSSRFPERSDVHAAEIYALKDLGEVRSTDPTVRPPTTSSVFRDYLKDRKVGPIFVRIPAASAHKANDLLSKFETSV
jgi:hypothetical protein